MGEPTAPVLPNDAPQDVKDFFDCKGDKLEWKKGKVTWLGLPVDPEVSFEHGKAEGSIDITIDFPLIPKFTLNASVNAAGELVVDTSKIPDLSKIKDGAGPKGVDDAVKNINDWFKKNGKKLKKATYKKGVVVLEKTSIQTAYLPPAAVGAEAVASAPVSDVATRPAVASAAAGGAGLMMAGLLVITVFVGGAIGYTLVAGPGPAAQASATPTTSPTASPSATPTASPTASPTITPEPSVTPEPTATATSGAQAYFAGICARVKHEKLGNFLSYIEWLMYSDYLDVDHFVVTVAGANNGDPVDLVFDPATGAFTGRLGLMSAGEKQIGQVIAVLDDGTPLDITADVIEILGQILGVRFPQQDSFGNACPVD